MMVMKLKKIVINPTTRTLVNHLPRGILNKPCEVVPLDEDDWELEDLLPLSTLQKNMKTYKEVDAKKSNPIKCTQNADDVPTGHMITECTGKVPSSEAKNASSPVEIFKLFFDDKLMSLIITESNK